MLTRHMTKTVNGFPAEAVGQLNLEEPGSTRALKFILDGLGVKGVDKLEFIDVQKVQAAAMREERTEKYRFTTTGVIRRLTEQVLAAGGFPVLDTANGLRLVVFPSWVVEKMPGIRAMTLGEHSRLHLLLSPAVRVLSHKWKVVELRKDITPDGLAEFLVRREKPFGKAFRAPRLQKKIEGMGIPKFLDDFFDGGNPISDETDVVQGRAYAITDGKLGFAKGTWFSDPELAEFLAGRRVKLGEFWPWNIKSVPEGQTRFAMTTISQTITPKRTGVVNHQVVRFLDRETAHDVIESSGWLDSIGNGVGAIAELLSGDWKPAKEFFGVQSDTVGAKAMLWPNLLKTVLGRFIGAGLSFHIVKRYLRHEVPGAWSFLKPSSDLPPSMTIDDRSVVPVRAPNNSGLVGRTVLLFRAPIITPGAVLPALVVGDSGDNAIEVNPEIVKRNLRGDFDGDPGFLVDVRPGKAAMDELSHEMIVVWNAHENGWAHEPQMEVRKEETTPEDLTVMAVEMLTFPSINRMDAAITDAMSVVQGRGEQFDIVEWLNRGLMIEAAIDQKKKKLLEPMSVESFREGLSKVLGVKLDNSFGPGLMRAMLFKNPRAISRKVLEVLKNVQLDEPRHLEFEVNPKTFEQRPDPLINPEYQIIFHDLPVGLSWRPFFKSLGSQNLPVFTSWIGHSAWLRQADAFIANAMDGIEGSAMAERMDLLTGMTFPVPTKGLRDIWEACRKVLKAWKKDPSDPQVIAAEDEWKEIGRRDEEGQPVHTKEEQEELKDALFGPKPLWVWIGVVMRNMTMGNGKPGRWFNNFELLNQGVPAIAWYAIDRGMVDQLAPIDPDTLVPEERQYPEEHWMERE